MTHQLHDFSNMVEFDALAQSITAKLRCDTSLISVVNVDALISLGYSGDAPLQAARTFKLHDTVCARTVRAAKPVRIADAKNDPAVRNIPSVTSFDIGAYMGVPLKIEGYGVVGAVCAITASPRLWQDSEVDYLIAVCDLVESKIERQMLRFEQKALSDALAENDAILTMLSQMEGKALTVHNAEGDLVFANSALRTKLNLNTREVLSLPQVARRLEADFTDRRGVDVALPVPEQTALNVHVSAHQNGLTLARWSRKTSK